MNFYLTTYHPLCENRAGIAAASKHSHRLFVDASCRREPDFEAQPPSITALCRGRNFAPRLRVGDVAIYATVLNRYPGNPEPAWRLVAALQVTQSFNSHVEAAEWYLRQGLTLPRNCLVQHNPPLGIDHTARPSAVLDDWDATYHARVARYPTFHVCESLFLELCKPPLLTPELMLNALGTDRPPSRTPKAWPRAWIERLLKGVGVNIEPQPLFDLVAKADVSHLPPAQTPRPSDVAPGGARPGGNSVRARRVRRGGC